MSEEMENSDAVESGDTEPTRALPHSWLSLGFGLAAICIFAVSTGIIINGYLNSRPIDLRDESLRTFNHIEKFFLSHHIGADSILKSEPTLQKNRKIALYFTTYDVELPGSLSPDGMKLLLERRMRPHHIQVTDWIEEGVKKGVHLTYGGYPLAKMTFTAARPRQGDDEERVRVDPTPVPTAITKKPSSNRSWPLTELRKQNASSATLAVPALQAATGIPVPNNIGRPRMAIIVDDGGYGGAHTEAILTLDNRLTLSILPNTPQGTSLAREAARLGFEVMLHMPMENTSANMHHEGEITVDMAAGQMAQLMHSALVQVPGAVGINNHTGSKFTQNASAMKHFLAEVKGTGLYFVDSRTTPKARGYEVARALQIPAAERGIFLDHDNDLDAIRARFYESMDAAQRNGTFIAICHFRRNTAQVLIELLPELEKRNIELVRASELVQ